MENKKIILVEDNKFDAQFVQLALKSTSFEGEIVWLKNGASFLEYTETCTCEEIIFVLMDIKMPKLTGLEVLQKLQDRKNLICPIIMFSASKHERDVKLARDLGAFAYMTKPIDFEGFERIIHTIWTFCGELDEVNKFRFFVDKKSQILT